eukprot:CAMPEP_0183708246 /NCGR_PEP_ID=MMETSP0737-20130205/4613_1 /TAXON_ID=385413 /ORGANISM="Thalassiosira miniscula, Strain CCMP1093" /LENGTH=358 /DNA_ID=CAMNT_0025936087 /DNA_START=77 /DNA_END=1153 /DNA_ORIENTATION=-
MDLLKPSPSPPPVSYAPLPQSGDSVNDEKEKAIPFLRQLTEMLRNNEELISFVPGQRLPNKTINSRIIVHDRNRVQSEVLPIYFNHASFASLRRQLSYFSFVRVGKSRQCGVSYTNDLVVDLQDILRLKRRTSGGGQARGAVKQSQQKDQTPIQQQQEQHLVKTSADVVASAVLSGTLRAAKTNYDLDDSNSRNAKEGARFSSMSNMDSSTTPQSSISNSFSQSGLSSSSSDNVSESKISERNSGNGNGDPKSIKPQAQKRRRALVVKHPIAKKDLARSDRLLLMNNIVPFIHLPDRLTFGRSRKKEGSPTAIAAGCGGGTTHAVRETAVQKDSKLKGRDRATSFGAASALLAMGSDS